MRDSPVEIWSQLLQCNVGVGILICRSCCLLMIGWSSLPSIDPSLRLPCIDWCPSFLNKMQTALYNGIVGTYVPGHLECRTFSCYSYQNLMMAVHGLWKYFYSYSLTLYAKNACTYTTCIVNIWRIEVLPFHYIELTILMVWVSTWIHTAMWSIIISMTFWNNPT